MNIKVKGEVIKENSILEKSLSQAVRNKLNTSSKYIGLESAGAFGGTFTKIDDTTIKYTYSDYGGMPIGGLIQEVSYYNQCVLIDCIKDGFIKLDTGDDLNGYEEEVFKLKYFTYNGEIVHNFNGYFDTIIFKYEGDDIDAAINKLKTYKFYMWEPGYNPARIPQAFIKMPYIDPVVWKYMCNPLVIKNGAKVPNELIGEYSNDVGYSGGYCLKYPNLAMYKIMITSDRIDSEFGGDCSVIITPSSINEYGLGIQDIYISKDYGVYAGGANIDKDKKWEIQ